MNILKSITVYFREKQSPKIIYLHVTILLLVLSQILVSNFMDIDRSGKISSDTLEFFGTWLHMITGLLLIPLTLYFVIVELRTHGLKYFFPYFYGEFTQAKNDIIELLKFKLPDASEYGLATIIQGLGLGALILVLISGATWFTSWYLGLGISHDLKELHETLTGLIEAYVIGHGCFGVLHLFLNYRSNLITK